MGRSALAAPRGHGPARALLPLCLGRGRRSGPGLTGSAGFGRVSSRGPGPHPGPWEGSGALGAASPRVGCGRPLAGAPRAHSPARGAGNGARLASGRCARLVSGLGPGGRAGLRSGIAGPPRFARSLALVSRPPAGRDARSRAGSASNWPPVGDICIARPRPARPARPHPRGGTRLAAVPPPLHLSEDWAQGSPSVGQPAPGEANLPSAPPPRLRGRRPRPALALSFSVDTPRTSRLVFTRALNSLAGRAGAPGSSEPALTCAPPAVSLLTTRCPPRLAPREPGPRTAPGRSAGGGTAPGTAGTAGHASRLRPRPGQPYSSVQQLQGSQPSLQQPALFQACSPPDPSL